MQHRRASNSVLFAMAVVVAGLGNTRCSSASKDVPPSGLSYSAEIAVYTVGTPITANTPTSTGGNAGSYSVAPPLPGGLGLDTTTGVISGTPTVAAVTANYTVIATNGGGSAKATLTITVNDTPPTNLTYSANPAVYTLETPIQPNKPSNTGGKVVTYTGTVSAGLTLDSTTGVISGTPTSVTGPVKFTVIAINSGGSTTASLTISVNNLAPSNLSYATTVAVYAVGTPITANVPTNSGGAVGSYTVAPPLPAGLTLDPITGVISGAPSAVAAMANYTLKASNFVGSTTTTLTISVNDIPPSGLSYPASPAVYAVGTPITPSAPTNTGGAVVSYSVSPPLPAGLTLSPSTGIISGTPTAVAPTASYVVTATNSGGSTTGSVTITVNDAPPANLTYSTNPAVYTVGLAIAANTPSNTGGKVVSYSVNPPLPAGLTLSPTTGVIAGVPATITALASYVVTATNTGGSTTTSVTITVNALGPNNFTYSTNPAVYTIGVAITPNTPSNTGGKVVSYSVSPPLPLGLALNTTTGVISGTPTTVTASANYTVTASNTGGNATAIVSITVNDVPPSALHYSTNPAVYTLGTAIPANTPTSSGGKVISYSVLPALPLGLVLNATTGVISGTPTTVTAVGSYVVTATNSGGSTTASLSITVNDVAPSSLRYTPNPAVYTVGAAITPNTPTNSGGKVVTYSVSPALPLGLSLNTSTGVISGTPTAVTAIGNYVVTGTNSGGSTTVSLSITINAVAPSGLSYSLNPAVYTVGTAIAPNTPTSSGGPVVSYSVSPALPLGLVLNATTGVISGTPTTVTAVGSYVVTATNSGGSTTASLSITVNDAAPSALRYSTNPAVYAVGAAITPNTPTNSGGKVVSYSVAPALPLGLSLNTSTGVISGTPTAVTAIGNYVVTGTNSGGSTTVSLSITINATAPSGLVYSQNPAVYTVGTAIAPNTPTSGGGAIVSYSVSPGLPLGLGLNASTGVISGTPTTVTAVGTYVVTATNSGGSITANVIITVNAVAPSGLSYSLNPAVYTVGTAIAPNTPTSSGGPVVTYSVSPALPLGLGLNASTGVISGTPTTVTAVGTYVVTAANSGGSTTANVSITVNAVAPSGLSYSLNPAVYTLGTAIAPNTPTSGGGPVVTYSVSPALPLGLGLNASTGAISGTPTTVTAVGTYVVTAANSGGSTTANVSITVNAAAPTGLAYSLNPAVYTVGTAIAPNTPTNGGGAVVSYSVSPALPTGLSLDPGTGILSGTPTAAADLAVYTVLATNSGGSTTASVTITVNAAAPASVATSAPSNLSYSANPAEYTLGTAIPVNVPSNSGGAVSSYSVSPALPAGLSIDPTAGILSGTPSAVAALANYTITATNAVGSTTVSVALSVNALLPTAFAVVANGSDGTLSLFTVNAGTGPLRTNGYVLAGANPRMVAVDSSGSFAYVTTTNSGTNALLVFNVNASTGAVTSLGAVTAGSQPYAVAVDPSDRFVYVTNFVSNDVSAFTLNTTTGALSSVGPAVPAGKGPASLAVDPSGRFLYVGNQTSNDVSSFLISQSTGALTAVAPALSAGTNPAAVAVDPTGRFVYVTNQTSGDVSAYAINEGTGALSSIGPTTVAGKGPSSIGIDPTGSFAYVTNYLDHTVSAFTVNASTGALTSLGPVVPAGNSPISLRVDPSGSFVYVTNDSAANVSVYGIKPGVGTLSPMQTVAARAGATSVALIQRTTALQYVPKNAYVANLSANTVWVYAIDPSSGGLTGVGAPVATGAGPASLTVDPSGSFAYVANSIDGTVSAYAVDSNTGGLTAIGGAVPTGTSPISVAVDPSGRFLYAANYGANTVAAFAINRSTGALSSIGPSVSTGTGPASVSVDPSGRFAYVANATAGTVSAYGINAGTGALSSLGPDVAAGVLPMSIGVDPSGALAYVANSGSNDVQTYAIDPNTGGLVAVGSALPTGTQPMSIGIDPWGAFAYVADCLSSDSFAVNTNPLSGLGSAAAGTQPMSVSVEPSGGFVYVANYGSGNVSVYKINSLSGVLTTVGVPVATGTNPNSVFATGALQ